MRRAEFITFLVLLLFSVLAIYDSFRLGIGWGLAGPRPGFFAFWLGLGMGTCSGIGLIRILRDAKAFEGREFISQASLPEVLKVFLPMVGAVLLMEYLGFYIASALYLGFFMRWVGRFSWRLVVLVVFLFTVSHYFVFEKWFLSPLPKGLLEPYIGI